MVLLGSRVFLFGVIIFAPLGAIPAVSIWNGLGSEQDMNNPLYWSPTGVPNGSVKVIFDSSTENVNLSPTQSADNFSVCSIFFPNSASPFTINFNNHEVALNGLGIIGSQTNATFNATNTNNLTTLGNQFSFNRGSDSSSGSAILNISNRGSQLLNSSGVTLSNMDNQFYAQGPFSMLNGGSLALTNRGSDSSHGTGLNNISYLTAYQAQMNDTNAVEDNVTIALSNSGTYSGSNSLSGNNVGFVISGQYYNNNTFVAGNGLDFSATNSGVNSGTSEGGSNIGVVGSSQINFNSTCSLGNSNTITISNYGENSGNSGTNNSNILNIGTVNEHQLFINAQFVAGDDLSLTATNVGIDSGSGSGQTYVGWITSGGSDGDQVMFNNSCTVGKQAAFAVQNSGTCSGTKQAGAVTSVAQLNSHQMAFIGEFQADDFLNLSITNNGTDSSHSNDANSTSAVSGDQLKFGSSAIIQNNATITVSNHGNFSGNSEIITNYVCPLGGPQFEVVGSFEAQNSFSLQIENIGEDTGSGAGSNLIGSAGEQQAYFQGSCTLGDDANIVISNTGTNSNESSSNRTGYVNLSQLQVSDAFSAGTNLNLSITNSATNTGNASNFVGYVGVSQALFNGTVTLGDGSLISVTNNGDVEGEQITFNHGFTVPSGKVTIQVINQGTRFSDIGMSIHGTNLGGNANIILEDARLDIDTTLASFTIGELNGDASSIVKSFQPLIINTDSSTNGLFSGSIQNYFGTPLILTKEGPGAQTLSGINTYTGLTSIQEGVLSITGSIVGDITVNSGGSLKGSGTIGGETIIENGAILSPGNSIGTINLGSLLLNSGSTTAIEIDPAASSKVNVVGSAVVAGALQVIQDPGVYPHQGSYQILTAGSLSGAFSSVNTFPGFTFSLSYLGNDIYLNYILAIPTGGLYGNLLTVANYLNGDAPPSSEFMSLAVLSGDQLKQALNSVSPARNAFGPFVTQQTLFVVSDMMSNHLATKRFLQQSNPAAFSPKVAKLVADASNQCLPTCINGEDLLPYEVWVSGFAEFATQAAESQNPSFNFMSEGAVVAFDYSKFCDKLIGGGIGYAHSQVHDGSHMGKSQIPYYFATIYGSFLLDHFYIEPAFLAAFHQIYNRRFISYPGVNLTAKGTVNGWQIDPHLGFGYDIDTSWSGIEPFAALDWVVNWEGDLNEHGAGALDMRQKSHTSSMLQSEIGIRFFQSLCRSWGRFGVKEEASYLNRAPFGTGSVTAAIVGSPAFMTLQSLTKVQNLGAVTIDLFAEVGKNQDVFINLGYEGEFGTNYISNEVLLRIAKQF